MSDFPCCYVYAWVDAEAMSLNIIREGGLDVLMDYTRSHLLFVRAGAMVGLRNLSECGTHTAGLCMGVLHSQITDISRTCCCYLWLLWWL